MNPTIIPSSPLGLLRQRRDTSFRVTKKRPEYSLAGVWMMVPLSVKDYKPPFVTETDEVRWDDCTVCSTLMAVASATLGEVVSKPDWSTLGDSGLKARREKIRDWLPPDKQNGSTTMTDMRYAFKKEFPWLPFEIPHYEEQKNTWQDVLLGLLDKRTVAVLLGNPSDVKDESSPLRRWTNNDDFGHAIYADHAKKGEDGSVSIFIMDPLGRGNYEGQYVSASDVRQFLWDDGDSVKATMFPRGKWAQSNPRRVQLVTDNNAELRSKVAALESDNARLVEEAQKQDKTCSDKDAKIASLDAHVDELTSRLETSKKAIANQKDKIELQRRLIKRLWTRIKALSNP
jgi:hypothetical protein